MAYLSESRFSAVPTPRTLRLPVRPPRPAGEFDRLFSTAIGGAFLGASLAGWVGLALGALAGLAAADSVNRGQRRQAR